MENVVLKLNGDISRVTIIPIVTLKMSLMNQTNMQGRKCASKTVPAITTSSDIQYSLRING